MVAGKKFIVPTMVAIVLFCLLIAIGWLAYRFFDSLATRAVSAEPFFAVTTGAVERITAPPARTQDKIILDAAPEVPSVETATKPPATKTDPSLSPRPAVCINYEHAITSRKAWPHPLTHTASITPNLVTVRIIPPADTEEDTE